MAEDSKQVRLPVGQAHLFAKSGCMPNMTGPRQNSEGLLLHISVADDIILYYL